MTASSKLEGDSGSKLEGDHFKLSKLKVTLAVNLKLKFTSNLEAVTQAVNLKVTLTVNFKW